MANLAALYNAGVLLAQKGEAEAARSYFETCLNLNHDMGPAHVALGIVLMELGEMETAEVHLNTALGLDPDNAVALSNLGVALIQTDRPAEAKDVLEKALALDPGNIGAKNNYAMALEHLGLVMDAIETYREVLDQAPDYGDGAVNLGRLLRAIGRAQEAVAVYDKTLAVNPNNDEVRENRLFALLYDPSVSAEVLAREHLAWGAGEPDRQARDFKLPLKVGLLSPDFRVHSVAYFVAPLLAGHDKTRVEIFCYSDTKSPDAMTKRLTYLADHWRDTHRYDDETLVNMIKVDGIDVLLDLAGHTAGGRMGVLAQRAAPLQGSWIGYPHPIGLAQSDFFITDEIASPRNNPAGADDLYSPEALLRLSGPFSCFEAPKDAPAPAPVADGPAVFVSFNNYAKMSDGVVALWADILGQEPDSTLLLKSWQFADEGIARDARARFEVHGLDPDRLRFAGNIPSYHEHLALYGQAHVALDTFPYNGTTTTCEALWMGLPVVALAGETHRSRVSMSLLKHAGLESLIAETPEDYVRMALTLARDRALLTKLRREQRPALAASALCDGKALARNLEDALLAFAREAEG